jgi:hypothetical protein
MKDFKYWDNLSKSEKLEEFSFDPTGLLWLKTKSIIRKELVKKFLDFSGLNISSTKQGQNFIELFELLSKDLDKSHKLLNKFIRQINEEEVGNLDTEQLVSELYKL